MALTDLFLENLNWIILFGILLIIVLLILIFGNSRAKFNIGSTSLGMGGLILMLLLPAPWIYGLLLLEIIFVIIFLNGKGTEHFVIEEPNNLFVHEETPVWEQYNDPPESKDWQEKRMKEESK